MAYANPYELIDRRLSAIEKALQDLRKYNLDSVNVCSDSSKALPILSSEQVKEMTGWPDGTFYQKVNEMPEGIVIRGRSKRLLFDRENFLIWLRNPPKL